jgi:ATP-dependent RNA helicase DeaD
MAETDFDALIGPELASAIAKKGYETLTPVQEAVLDPALAGRDLRISSQTGSGKTLAIGFIVREAVKGDTPSSPKGAAMPRALVVTPTRELAKQVEVELSWLFAPLRVKVASVTGGGNYRDERRALGSGPAIIVGTPGRLLDHLQRGAIDGSQLGAVVLDEADRMLDLGFRDDLEAILGFAPEGHRTHLVSATFPREVMTLANRVQTDPARIEGTPIGAANTDIEHLVHLVLPHERLDAIMNLLLETPDATSLIFARTRADVGEITHLLADAGFIVDSLSGEMEQRERNKALAAFKRGDLHALVATDVAARGIDVQDVVRVIHAEPPMDPDSYTHRSGRTGRAGRKGTSSVIVTPPALNRVSGLLKRAGVRWRIEPVPTAEVIEAAREQRLYDALTTVAPPEDPTEEVTESARVGGPIEADDRSWALAKRIAEAGEATRALARMIARTRASGPEARRITPVLPPGQKKRPWDQPASGDARDARPAQPRNEGRPFAEHRTFGEPRGLRPERASHDDRAPARDGGFEGGREREPGPARMPRDAATDAGAWVSFRVTWGQIHGADARRLLAMVCRRGGIRGSDVGAIRVQRTFSTVDVAAAAAPTFERATRDPDPRDPRVKIHPANEVVHGDRPAPAAKAEAEAEAEAYVPASPMIARKSTRMLEGDRPSKTAAKSERTLEVDRPSKTAAKSERTLEVDRPSKTAAKSEHTLEVDRPSKTAAKSERTLEVDRHSKTAAKSVRTLEVDRPSKPARTLEVDRPSRTARAEAPIEADRPSKTKAPEPKPAEKADKAEKADNPAKDNDAERPSSRSAHGDRRPRPSQPERYSRRPPPGRPSEDRPRPSNDRPRPSHDGPRPSHDRPRSQHDGPRPSNDGPRPFDRSRPPPGGDRDRPRPPFDRSRPPNDRARPQHDGPRPSHGGPRPHAGGQGPRPGGPGPRPGGGAGGGGRPGGPRPGGPPPSRHGDAPPKRKKP